MSRSNHHRRRFLAGSTTSAAALLFPLPANAMSEEGDIAGLDCFQAMGTRVGDVTHDSAVVWSRITISAERNNAGLLIPGRANGRKDLPQVTVPVPELEGACPGCPGQVRVCYGTDPTLETATQTEWANVDSDGDFIHQTMLTRLQSGTQYFYASQVRKHADGPIHTHRGQFRTAPAADRAADVRFSVMTCQGYPDRGHAEGHPIYPAMLEYGPDFTLMTGDLVYYDNDLPRAVTPELARFHWQRMFSLPRLVTFLSSTSTYWLKDDHDTLKDDSWSGQRLGELEFEKGQAIFRQQAPMRPGPAYRTFRWGRDLQIWLSDGRDFRSPNRMQDGPEKTIWGQVQKDWFKRTVKESDATWKLLISPTPFVGPDRKNKNDNHANAAFQQEGEELRHWLHDNAPDLAVICGDRHWQYHSVDPETGLHEFSVGAASNEHAGGSPGFQPDYHRFHRVKGGFLTVQVDRLDGAPRIRFQHRDVDGNVVYEFERQ